MSSFPKEITLNEKLSVTKADTITTDDKKLVTVEAWNVTITLSLSSIYFK